MADFETVTVETDLLICGGGMAACGAAVEACIRPLSEQCTSGLSGHLPCHAQVGFLKGYATKQNECLCAAL